MSAEGWGKSDAVASGSSGWGAPPKVTDLDAKKGWGDISPVSANGADIDSVTKGVEGLLGSKAGSPDKANATAAPTSNEKAKARETADGAEDDVPGKNSNLLESEHDVEVKLSDLQVSADAKLYNAISKFEELGLHPDLLKGLYAMGFKAPSKIQERALPMLLANPPRNMIGQSQSGTGKTAAFTLTMLSRVDFNLPTTQAICLAPARELARQIMDVVREMGKFTPVTTAFAIKDSIEKGAKVNAHIVVGTPGTVMDLLKRRQIDNKDIRIFVLDEADNMIDQQGLGDQSIRVRMMMPKTCQLVLFSATFTEELRMFAQKVAPNANEISLKREELSVDAIRQCYMDCKNEDHKVEVLMNIYGLLTIGQSIVFVRRKDKAEQIAREMTDQGHEVLLLHGSLDAAMRDQAIDDFRDGKKKVLITTNVLARGIDILQVNLVINFDMPLDANRQPDPETYLHRIGRTGRFGRTGMSINFVHDQRSYDEMKAIEGHFGREIVRVPTEDISQLEAFLKKLSKRDALVSMLNLNNSNEATLAVDDGSAALGVAPKEPVWKVLIYDQESQEIISPILKVNDLRENGITIHMALRTDRQPIPDVPAVYFLTPTPENIKLLSEDFAKGLYDSYYINFTSTLSRPLLEELASSAIATGASSKISQVYDQYLNFISLEMNLFTLNFADTYYLLNNSSTSDTAIEMHINKIVGSLFSVLVTMGVIPIIRSPSGNAAESVATKLDAKLRDHLANTRNNLFQDSSLSGTLSRPVLVISDRSSDLVSMLSHTWTYSSLVHDILGMKLNRVAVTIEEKGAKLKKNYDLDITDFFWAKNTGNPFPEVAGKLQRKKSLIDQIGSCFPEDVSAELNKYKKDVDEVTRSSGVSSLEEVDPSNANSLKLAMTALPELTERKRILDMHMNIATSLFKIIADRQLDAFFSLEESLTKQSKATVLELLRDPKKAVEDKIRLMLLFYITVEDVSKEDLAAMEEAVKASEGSTAALAYVKSVRSFSKIAAASNVTQSSSTTSDFLGKFTSIGSKLAGHLEGAGVSGGFENLIAGVKNLLPTRRDLPLTKVVDAIMEGTANAETDDYLYFDPKAPKGSGSKLKKGKQTFQEAIVFVIGGGNYLEYQNLQDYAQKSTQKKKICYGSTEVLSASQFVAQLDKLGSA
ncbi:RNA helicase required for poly(A+) mRNA export [Phlyctochytrium planicorne]|nr:RNA helicase required for poly(A+) mRNA export [Phlyctochytrium planicorne]